MEFFSNSFRMSNMQSIWKYLNTLQCCFVFLATGENKIFRKTFSKCSSNISLKCCHRDFRKHLLKHFKKKFKNISRYVSVPGYQNVLEMFERYFNNIPTML